jgi:inosose dehydratase
MTRSNQKGYSAMSSEMTRRTFSKTIASCLGAAALGGVHLHASQTRRLKIGHTCITWGTFPNTPDTLEPAMRDIANLGYTGFETFPQVLEELDKRGEMSALIDKYKLPFIAGYHFPNVLDPSVRKQELQEVIRLANVVKKYGGNFLVLQAHNSVRNIPNYAAAFPEHKANIVAALNDYGKAIADVGLGAGLHQHTGTAVDTEEQVYAVMEAVDTRVMKFAPDVGQLQKAGGDAAKIVRDFKDITAHIHLKDWSGWQHYGGYCPLGEGKVDIVSILNTLEEASPNANINVELDPSRNPPYTPLQTAEIAKKYLQNMGYTFRASVTA